MLRVLCLPEYIVRVLCIHRSGLVREVVNAEAGGPLTGPHAINLIKSYLAYKIPEIPTLAQAYSCGV